MLASTKYNLNLLPMGKLDTVFNIGAVNDEESLFLESVIEGDAELLYLDTYLTELFGLH